LVCFLEDDVVLEPDYFAEIEVGFNQRPDMLGCCGVVVDVGPMPSGYVSFFQTFHRGIFMDPRVGVHGHVVGKGHALIPSPTLSGGLSAWRREVFATISFDTVNDFFMLEDIEFSTRAAMELGPRFFINPNARLEHHASLVNRARLSARQRRKIREYIVFYKKRKTWPMATSSLAWLMLGLFFESLFQALRYRSPSLVVNFFAGIVDGMRWDLKAS
jgi:GT2 family glycosyltransferase